jgi:hypothetical protein
VTAFNKSLSANQTFKGTLATLRWYAGTFKQTSLGIIRAAYRTVKIITANRNLT